MTADGTRHGSKVPAITILFWLIKIAATTLGETGGDALSMSLGLGYLLGSLVFALLFAVTVSAQVRLRHFNPAIYWLTIIATTTLGTTLADYATRSLGIGYAGGSALLLALLAASLLFWRWHLGEISSASIDTASAERHYWLVVLCSQTLGTALGDWSADSAGLGYDGAALIFGAALLLIVAAYAFTRLSRTALFWAAFILTRPLGAAVGDYLDKPVADGGLALSRVAASAVLLAVIIVLVALSMRRRTTPLQ